MYLVAADLAVEGMRSEVSLVRQSHGLVAGAAEKVPRLEARLVLDICRPCHPSVWWPFTCATISTGSYADAQIHALAAAAAAGEASRKHCVTRCCAVPQCGEVPRDRLVELRHLARAVHKALPHLAQTLS